MNMKNRIKTALVVMTSIMFPLMASASVVKGSLRDDESDETLLIILIMLLSFRFLFVNMQNI